MNEHTDIHRNGQTYRRIKRFIEDAVPIKYLVSNMMVLDGIGELIPAVPSVQKPTWSKRHN